jgi:hypothetical protein
MLHVHRAKPEAPRRSATGAATTGAAAAAGAAGTAAAAAGATIAAAAGFAAANAAGSTGVATIGAAATDAAGGDASTGAAIGGTAAAATGAAAAATVGGTPIAAAAAAAPARSTDHSERIDSAPRSTLAAATNAPGDTVANVLREMAYRCDTALLRRWIQAADFGVTFVLQLPRPVPPQNLLCMLSKLAEEHSSRGDTPSTELMQYVIQQLKAAPAACEQKAAAAGSVQHTEPETEPKAEPRSVAKEWVLLLQRRAQLSTVMLKEVSSLQYAVLAHTAAVYTATSSCCECLSFLLA